MPLYTLTQKANTFNHQWWSHENLEYNGI